MMKLTPIMKRITMPTLLKIENRDDNDRAGVDYDDDAGDVNEENSDSEKRAEIHKQLYEKFFCV